MRKVISKLGHHPIRQVRTFCSCQNFKWGATKAAEDCCLAAQNRMLAACGMGLGTCPIGFARPWLNLPEVKRELGIPDNYASVLPVIVGFPKGDPPPVARKEPEILFWKGPLE